MDNSADLVSKIYSGVTLRSNTQALVCRNAGTEKIVLMVDVGRDLMVLQGTLIADSIMVTTLDVVKLDIGDPPVIIPTTLLQIYDNDALPDAQIVVEQGGSGDATLRFVLSGSTDYILGIDNSANNNPFKIAASTVLGTSNVLILDHVDCNIGIGLGALGSIVAGGTNNIAIGNSVLSAVTTEDDNTAVGCEALEANTASENTAVGKQALEANTTGVCNTSIGHQALQANVTADRNTAVGYHAGLNTVAANNTFIGCLSGEENTIGADNTMLGSQSFEFGTGDDNVAVGVGSLRGATGTNTGTVNTAVGARSLNTITSGTQNVAVGGDSLLVNTTGSDNVAAGKNALSANTTGDNNTAVGTSALMLNDTTEDNTAIGWMTLRDNVADDNTALGSNAAVLNTTGTFNTALGRSSLSTNTTGDNNTAVGHRTLVSNIGSDNTAVGSRALDANTTGAGNVAVGDEALGGNSTGDDNVAVGHRALEANTTNANIAIGSFSLSSNTSGDDNVAVGFNTLNVNVIGTNNTAVGSRVLELATASSNTAIGSRSLDILTTGSRNTAVGRNTLGLLVTGDDNISVGYDAGVAHTLSDSDNIDIGNIGVAGESAVARIGVPGTHTTFLAGPTLQGGAISAVTTITAVDSGTWYNVTQGGAIYAITLPSPPIPGANYKFIIGTTSGFDVTISNGSAHLFGTIINDITSVIPATGTTITFVGTIAAVGDSVEVYGIDSTHWFVKAVTSTAGGITIT